MPYSNTDRGCATKGLIHARSVDCTGGATSVDEVMGGVREYQYSSIMDYGAEFNSDLQGLGKYDKAAMKFSYAGDGYVEVFTDQAFGGSGADPNTPQARFEAVQYFSGAFGFPSPLALYSSATGHLESINYTTYPQLFNSGIGGFEMRADVPAYSVSLHYIERAGRAGRRVAPAMRLKQPMQGSGNLMPRVPYFFCSDEFVGNLSCQRFDFGADAYEQGRTSSHALPELLHAQRNFKRLARYTFHTSSSYASRISGRYFDMLRDQLTWYALLRADFTDYEYDTPDGLNTFFTDPDNGWGSFSIGVIGRRSTDIRRKNDSRCRRLAPFKFISASDDDGTCRSATSSSSSDDVRLDDGRSTQYVPILQGKYIDTTWDFNGCGYYWADQCQTRIGYLIDKMVAMDVLTQSQAYFTGRDTATDVRRYAIGYIRPYKNQINEKIGALLAQDYTSLATYHQTDPMTKANSTVLVSWALNNTSFANQPSKTG